MLANLWRFPHFSPPPRFMPIPEPEPTPRLDPASYDDEWDDPELLAEEQVIDRTILPPKREQPPASAKPARKRTKVEMGLQITAKVRTAPRTDDSEDDAVVKLDCPTADQAFQPTHMIIDRREKAPPPPPKPIGGKIREEHLEWGEKPKHSHHWLLRSGIAVALLLAAALTIQQLWVRNTDEEYKPQESLLEEREKLPEVEGFEIDGSSDRQSRALLATYAKARSASDILPFVRDRDSLVERITRDWTPWNVPANWSEPETCAWETGNESGRGFGLLCGSLPDLSRFRAYFVRENGVLRLDWEATTGACSTPFEMLVQGKGTGGKTRAFVKPDTFFTQAFPESLYRSFKLLSPDQTAVVWAYTKIGSPADNAIMAYFPSGILLESEHGELPMTVTLSPPDQNETQKNQWLLTEMLHNEWVSP